MTGALQSVATRLASALTWLSIPPEAVTRPLRSRVARVIVVGEELSGVDITQGRRVDAPSTVARWIASIAPESAC